MAGTHHLLVADLGGPAQPDGQRGGDCAAAQAALLQAGACRSPSWIHDFTTLLTADSCCHRQGWRGLGRCRHLVPEAALDTAQPHDATRQADGNAPPPKPHPVNLSSVHHPGAPQRNVGAEGNLESAPACRSSQADDMGDWCRGGHSRTPAQAPQG